MSKKTSLKFLPAAWMSDVEYINLSLSECGALHRLLFAALDKGGIPDTFNLNRLANAYSPEEEIAVQSVVTRFFLKDKQRRYQPDMSSLPSLFSLITHPDCHDARHRKAIAEARGSHTPRQWQAMLAHHENRCANPRCYSPKSAIVRSRITPVSAGGSDSISNLQPLCRVCSSVNHFNDAKDYRKAGWKQAVKDA